MLFTQQLYIPLPSFQLDDDATLPPASEVPPKPGERGYSIANNQRVIFLEEYAIAPLPQPIYIGETLIFFEGTAPFTPDMHGYLALAVDPQLRYCTRSGFPLVQTSEPENTISLGFHIIEGGNSQGLWQSHRYPVPYFPGDGVIVAVSGSSLRDTSGQYKSLRARFQIRYATDTEMVTRLGNDSLFSISSNDKPISDTRNYSIRNILPPAIQSGAGVRISFHHHSLATQPATFQAAVGIRYGRTSITKNPPIPLTKAGSPNFVIPPGGRLQTDPTLIDIAKGDQLTVNCYVQNSWSMRTLSHASTYYVVGVDSHLDMNMPTGTIYVPNRSYLVTDAELLF